MACTAAAFSNKLPILLPTVVNWSSTMVLADESAEMRDRFLELSGESYLAVLTRLHKYLRPRNYFEVGTEKGGTLRLANCPSISVDPMPAAELAVIKDKPLCCFFNMTSDRFFRDFDPRTIFKTEIEFAFLDGMHLFEFLLRDFINTERLCRRNSVIALHDCVPGDRWMAERALSPEGQSRSKRPNWWTGDVWKVLPVLKQARPDLRVTVVDAAPTGLVLITNLDPASTVLADSYAELVERYQDMDLGTYGVQALRDLYGLTSTAALRRDQDIAKRFWL